jgi:hypothetical protein
MTSVTSIRAAAYSSMMATLLISLMSVIAYAQRSSLYPKAPHIALHFVYCTLVNMVYIPVLGRTIIRLFTYSMAAGHTA